MPEKAYAVVCGRIPRFCMPWTKKRITKVLASVSHYDSFIGVIPGDVTFVIYKGLNDAKRAMNNLEAQNVSVLSEILDVNMEIITH